MASMVFFWKRKSGAGENGSARQSAGQFAAECRRPLAERHVGRRNYLT